MIFYLFYKPRRRSRRLEDKKAYPTSGAGVAMNTPSTGEAKNQEEIIVLPAAGVEGKLKIGGFKISGLVLQEKRK